MKNNIISQVCFINKNITRIRELKKCNGQMRHVNGGEVPPINYDDLLDYGENELKKLVQD